MNSLGIAIDGGRYVRIDSRTGDFPRRLRMRTLSPGQESARLDFCRFTRRGPRVLNSHRITGLDGRNGPAEFRLSAERRHFAVWEVRFTGGTNSKETLRIRTGTGLWPFILSGIVLAALLAFLAFLLMTRTGDSAAGGMTGPAVEAAATGTGITADRETHVSPEPEPEPSTPPAGTGLPEVSGEAAPVPEPESESEPEPEPAVVLPAPVYVYFQPESAVLDPAARSVLDRFAGEVPEQCLLVITGHSANYGTERGRVRLSELRARQVAEYISPGLAGGVIIETAARGGRDPVTDDPELQHLNRRVEIITREAGR